MLTNSIIIKFADTLIRQDSKQDLELTKIQGSIDLDSFIRLIRYADLKVNPRQARLNNIANVIIETLDTSPQLYFFKTKGLLLASRNVEYLERNRIRISFEDPDAEGIMDGGHNAIALAYFLIRDTLKKKIKTWEEVKSIWEEEFESIRTSFELLKIERPESYDIQIPVEIIHPSFPSENSIIDYEDNLVDICYSRNNNAQLSEASLQNKAGAHEELKSAFKELNLPISWKTGDGNRIKSENVISLACIPLKFILDNDLIKPTEGKDAITKRKKESFNPVSLYNAKSKCVEFYGSVIDLTCIQKNGEYQIEDSLLISAINLTPDIVRFFDNLYVSFPDMYNKNGGSFGKIGSVKNQKTSSPYFRTTKNQAKHTYPDAFIYPLLYGVISLIEYDSVNQRVKWVKDPNTIDLNSLEISSYVELFKLAKFMPNTIGKSLSFYDTALNIFKNHLAKS